MKRKNIISWCGNFYYTFGWRSNFWWLKSNDTNRQRSSLEEAIRNVNVNNEDEVLNNKVEPNPEVLALRQEKYYILEFEDRYLAYRGGEREDWVGRKL